MKKILRILQEGNLGLKHFEISCSNSNIVPDSTSGCLSPSCMVLYQGIWLVEAR